VTVRWFYQAENTTQRFAYRSMTWEKLKAAVFQSIRTSSMVLTLLVGSASRPTHSSC